MDRKTEYIVSELWILAWNASVQRAALYKRGARESNSDAINKYRNKLINYIESKLIPQYSVKVGEQQHCRNIQKLVDYANKIENGLLGEDGYKYGVAQKILNLSLKYYWCLGQIQEPPHCPVDRIVIDKTQYRGMINWTKILTEKEYLKIISAVKSLAEEENCSIAHWELMNYERREANQLHFEPSPANTEDQKSQYDKTEQRNQMLITHGGSKGKRFEYVLYGDFIKIKNEEERKEVYSLSEIFNILNWLVARFGAGWFPLGNNVEKLGKNKEIDGLGVAILRQKPGNVSHAQGSSYLGVVLENVGIFEWNNKMKGIEWRIISQPRSIDELKRTIKKKVNGVKISY